MTPLKIEYLPLSAFTPDPENAKDHPADQIEDIVASIKAFGFNDPVGVCGPDNKVVEGHGRLLAAGILGLAEAPAVRLDHLSDAEREAYALAHNQLNRKTGFDPLKLKVKLQTIKVAGLDLKPIGFAPLELKKIFKDPKREDDDAADDALSNAESASFVPFSQLGDLWSLGDHRLLCGDSTKAEDVQRVMCGKLADCVLTDPPYNVAYEGGTGLTIENDSMPDASFRQFLFDCFKAAFDVTKPGSAIYVFHADSEGFNFRGAMRDAGWGVKQCLIWMKSSLVMGRQDYQWKHEPILYSWKPGAAHRWFSDRCQTTILEFNKPHKNPDHPTPKPVEMLEYLLKNSSAEGDVVYEPFCGSGSTLIACEQTGRACHAIELAPRYVSVIVRRWAELTKQEPMVQRDGQTLTMTEAIDAAKVR